jgi:hypothetical protein
MAVHTLLLGDDSPPLSFYLHMKSSCFGCVAGGGLVNRTASLRRGRIMLLRLLFVATSSVSGLFSNSINSHVV